MASTQSAIGATERLAEGENLFWGDELNYTLNRIEEMAKGYKAVALSGDYTLTTTNYVENEARYFAIRFTDNGLSANPTVTVWAKAGYFALWNDTTRTISFKTATGTAATIRPGQKTPVWSDGTDCEAADPTLDEIKAPAASLDLNSQKITGLAEPTVATDGATKGYIDTLASSSNLGTVAGIADDITAVVGFESNITAVAGDEADIGTVATNIANVNSVAGNSANITTVAGMEANIATVIAEASDIGTVATDIADVSTVATNMADIQNASTIVSGITPASIGAAASSHTHTVSDITDLTLGTAANNVPQLNGSAKLASSTLDFASQAEAEAGTNNTKPLTALRTSQAIAALAAGGGGLEPIGNLLEPSGVAAVDIALPAGYSEFIIKFRDVLPDSNNRSLLARFSDDGGSTFRSSSGDYELGSIYLSFSSSLDTSRSTNASGMHLSGIGTGSGIGNAAGTTGATGEASIVSARDATKETLMFSRSTCELGTTTRYMIDGTSAAKSKNDDDYVRLYFNVGNIASGKIQLFGIPE